MTIQPFLLGLSPRSCVRIAAGHKHHGQIVRNLWVALRGGMGRIIDLAKHLQNCPYRLLNKTPAACKLFQHVSGISAVRASQIALNLARSHGICGRCAAVKSMGPTVRLFERRTV